MRILALLLTVALGVAGCSSAGGRGGTRLPADVADGLAARAEEVAAALDAGACDDALAKAKSLQNAVAGLATVDPALRAEALAGSARLVSSINCPPVVTPPPTAPAVPQPPAGGGKARKGHKGDRDDD